MGLDAELDEQWRQSEFFFNTDSLAISVAVDGGAVYALGLESLASDGLFGLTGAAWAARLKL